VTRALDSLVLVGVSLVLWAVLLLALLQILGMVA
jgi:hypothetical protein